MCQVSYDLHSYERNLKGHSHLWDRADLGTSFFHFEKSSPEPEIKRIGYT